MESVFKYTQERIIELSESLLNDTPECREREIASLRSDIEFDYDNEDLSQAEVIILKRKIEEMLVKLNEGI